MEGTFRRPEQIGGVAEDGEILRGRCRRRTSSKFAVFATTAGWLGISIWRSNSCIPEIVWTAIESAPDAGTRTGLDECRVYMEDWLEDFDFESHAIEAAGVALDERLVCANHAVGTGKGSGVRTEIRYAGTYRFADDGRIVEIHEYATLDEALEAAGLSE